MTCAARTAAIAIIETFEFVVACATLQIDARCSDRTAEGATVGINQDTLIIVDLGRTDNAAEGMSVQADMDLCGVAFSIEHDWSAGIRRQIHIDHTGGRFYINVYRCIDITSQ